MTGSSLPRSERTLPIQDRIATRTIWMYSLPHVAFGLVGLPFALYMMKFSTDVLLIAPATMGMLFFGSRLWDAVSDPMAGFLSDRTRSRFGRRRSWMFAAPIPIAIGTVKMVPSDARIAL